MPHSFFFAGDFCLFRFPVVRSSGNALRSGFSKAAGNLFLTKGSPLDTMLVTGMRIPGGYDAVFRIRGADSQKLPVPRPCV